MEFSLDAGFRETLQEELESLLTSTRDPMRRKAPRLESDRLRSFTVLSLGWEGSPELPELMGAGGSYEPLERLFEIFANVIARCDGYVLGYTDDGFQAVFACRQRARLSCERAARAGLSILQISRDLADLLAEHALELSVRMGVECVELPEETASREATLETQIDETVEAARSIQRAARANTLLVSERVAFMLGDDFVRGRKRELMIEGKPEPLRVTGIARVDLRYVQRWDWDELTSRVQFFGRLHELKALEEFYREPSSRSYPPEKWEITLGKVANRNRFLGLKGPAGCGKSRLVNEFVRRLRAKKGRPPPVHLVGVCPTYPAHYLSPFVEMILHRLELPLTANPHEKKLALDLLYFELARRLPEEVSELRLRLESTKIAVAHLLEASSDFSSFNHLDARSQDVEKRLGVRSLLESFYYEANAPVLPKLQAFWDRQSATLRAIVGRPGSTVPSLPESIPARPLVIQVEGLHRAPGSTLDFLQFLFETISLPQPVAFLGTYIPEFELPRRWSQSLMPGELSLERMADYELRMILNAMLGGFKFPAELEMKLFEKAQGNPLFLEELVYYLLVEGFIELDESEHSCRIARPLAEFELPEVLHELALGRIDVLEEPVKRVTQNASVLGQRFTVRALEQAEPQEQQALSEEVLFKVLEALRRTGIVRHVIKGSGMADWRRRAYTFHHVLHWEAAYSSVAPHRRKLLHRVVARLLEEEHREQVEQHLTSLAHHWEQGGVLTTSAGYWIRFSYRQLMRGALEEAKLTLNHVRGLLRRIKHDEEARIRLDLESKVALASVLMGLRRHQEAEQLCSEVRALAMAHHLAPQLSDAERMLGVILRDRHRYIDAEEHLHTALHLAREQDDARRVSQALNNLGLLYWELQRYERSLPVFDEALRIARKAQDKRVVAAALCNAGLAHGHGSRFRDGLELLERALAMTEETGDRWGRMGVLSNIAFFWSSRGRYDLKKRYASEADQTRKELGVEGRGVIAWWM